MAAPCHGHDKKGQDALRQNHFYRQIVELPSRRIYTADTDFRKFDFLEVINPLRA